MSNTHSENFKKLVTAAKALRVEPTSKQVATLKGKMADAIARQVTLTKGPVKRLYENAHNACVSMADGLRDDEVTKVDYQQFIAELSGLADKSVQIEVAASTKTTATRYSHGQDPDSWAQNDWQDQQKRAGQEDRYLEGNKKVIEKYRKYESMVPRTLVKKFVATRLPVLALTDPGLNREKLTELKMLADTFFGYPILKDQVLLGLNTDWVTSEYKRNIDEAIKDVLDVLKDTTGKSYYPIGEHKKRAQVDWVWLVTDQDMRKLNKASISGHFSLKAWSFPFEADETVRKPAPGG